GWGTSGNQTIFTPDELIRTFKITDISKKGAIFDLQKMIWINGQHISGKTATELFPWVSRAWIKAGLLSADEIEDRKVYLHQAINLLKTRMKLITDFVSFGSYVLKDPVNYDPEAAKKHWAHPQIQDLINHYIKALETLDPFDAENLEETLRHITDEAREKAAVLIHAVRLAVTGFSVSPGLFQLLSLLGKEVVIRRLKKALDYLQT
ncbi:MAG: Glutamate--tRNA ligase, partial [Marinimicrobia bacterium 46_43]